MDALDNVWVSTWRGNAVAAFNSHGDPLPGSPFPVKGTWGISLDGNENLWLAGFGAPDTNDGKSIYQMCGAASQACVAGDLLSPEDGWARNTGAMQRIVDAQTSSNGAVWCANNWKRQPTPLKNVGGNGLVCFPGLGVPPKKRILG